MNNNISIVPSNGNNYPIIPATVGPDAPPIQYASIDQKPAPAKEWTVREFTVNHPRWYDSRNTIRRLGYIFSGLTTAAAGATTYAALRFTGTPSTVIKTVSALAGLTLTLFGFTIVFFSKKQFLKDQDYLNEHGKAIWDHLRSKDTTLPYASMRKAFPETIRDTLNYNELLRHDAHKLIYKDFVAKHEDACLEILDGININYLAQSFFNGKSSSCLNEINDIPFNDLGLDPNRAIPEILKMEIQRWQDKTITFDQFRERNRSYIKILSLPQHAENREAIKVLFLNELQTSNLGLVFLKKKYVTEFVFFNITNEMLAAALWQHQKENSFSFSDFESEHGFDYIEAVIKHDPDALLLFEHICLKEPVQYITALGDYAHKILTITSESIVANLTWEINLNSTTYSTFTKKHDLKTVCSLAENGSFGSLSLLSLIKSKLLNHIANSDAGFLAIKKSYLEDAKLLGLQESDLEKSLLDSHEKFLIAFRNKPSWTSFFDSNGFDFSKKIVEKNQELKALLKESFLNDPSVDAQYKSIRTLLDITDDEFGFAVFKHAMTLTFADFKTRYGLETLSKREIIYQTKYLKLKDHFFNEFVKTLPPSLTQGEEGHLGFTMTDILVKRWEKKTILEIYKTDPKPFKDNFNNFNWTAKIEGEIQNKDLATILNSYPDFLFERVLTSASKNLQKAIIDFYLANLPLAYTQTHEILLTGVAVLTLMEQRNIVPSAALSNKIINAKVAYGILLQNKESDLTKCDKELLIAMKELVARRDLPIRRTAEKVEAFKKGENDLRTALQKLETLLSANQSDLELARKGDKYIQELESERESLAKAFNEATNIYDEAEKQLLSQKIEFERLQRESSHTQVTGIGAAFSATKLYTKELKEIENQLKELKNERDQKTPKSEKLRKKMQTMIDKTKDCINRKAALESSVSSLSKEVRNSKAQLILYTNDLEQAQKEYKAVEAAAKAEYSNATAKVEVEANKQKDAITSTFIKGVQGIEDDLRKFLTDQKAPAEA